MIREVAEETGCEAVVERLLGVDSRVIPAADRPSPGLPGHQNVGVFYENFPRNLSTSSMRRGIASRAMAMNAAFSSQRSSAISTYRGC